jgi:hypothetical protein
VNNSKDPSSIADDAAEMAVTVIIEENWWCSPPEYQDYLRERLTPPIRAAVEAGIALRLRELPRPSSN